MPIGFMGNWRLSSAKETFILDCKAADLAPRTLQIYRAVLTKFVEFTGDITVQELKPDHVRLYIAYMADQPERYKANGGKLSAYPLARHYAAIRTWIRWLYAQKLVTERSRFVTSPRLRDIFPARRWAYC